MKHNLLNGLACLTFLSLSITALSDDSIEDTVEIRINAFDSEARQPPQVISPSEIDSVSDNQHENERGIDQVADYIEDNNNDNVIIINDDTNPFEEGASAVVQDKGEVDNNDEDNSDSAPIVLNDAVLDDNLSVVPNDEIRKMEFEPVYVIKPDVAETETLINPDPVMASHANNESDKTTFSVNIDQNVETNNHESAVVVANQLDDNEFDTEKETETETETSQLEQVIIYEEDEEMQQTCESFFDLAATVMTARQKDVSIQVLHDAANVTYINSPQNESDTFIYSATTEMIELAYDFDIAPIDEQQEIAKQFAYDVYAGCMEMADRYSTVPSNQQNQQN